ncbi:MAG TPA: sulfotransferase [Gemmataceae bacterium]|jgi:tetratricopeptide (TPR) repeat protein|nr:sulfotransferase [Gemmataceae bacterium]
MLELIKPRHWRPHNPLAGCHNVHIRRPKRSMIDRWTRRLIAHSYHIAKKDFRQGRLRRAFRTLGFMAQFSPGSPPIHLLCARLALAAENPYLAERAVQPLKGAHRLQRVSWATNLARCQSDLDDVQDALSTLASAVNNFPASWVVWGLLGASHKRLDERDDAVRCFQEAFRLAPTQRTQLGVMYDLAECLEVFGDKQSAISLYQEIIQRSPIETLARFKLVHSQDQLDATSDSAQEFISLAGTASPTMDRQHLHYALGHLYDRSQRPAEAIAHFHLANRLRAATLPPWNVRQYRESVKRQIEIFNHDLITRLARYGSADDSQVFVVGMPRSGTTLVEQMLGAHSMVRGLGEREDIRRVTQVLPLELKGKEPYPECVKSLSAEVICRISHSMLSRRKRDAGPCLRMVSKLPHDVWELGLIAILFPKAHIIHCQRHPIDTCLSCYMQDFAYLAYATNLSALADIYELYTQIIEHWRGVLPSSSIYHISYEDLIKRPEEVLREMCSFCEIPFEEQCLRFYENRNQVNTSSRWQVRRSIYTTSQRRWERYREFLGPLLRLDKSLPTPAPGADLPEGTEAISG